MKKAFVSLFLIIPIVLSCVIFISPDKKLSENENRSLKKLSEISFYSFQEDFESYLSDQFPFRDKIASARSFVALAQGKRDINGAYVCKGRFVQKITEADVDREACIRYADKINSYAEKIPTYVLYVPSAGTVLKEALPPFAEMYNYENLLCSLQKKLPCANMVSTTAFSYYNTDHHWDADGAYSAYIQWCVAHDIKPKKYKLKTVTKDFKGTLYSKVLIDNVPADTIKAPVINDNIVVMADGREIPFYDESALATKDKYNYFQGGNHGVVTIENKSVSNGKVLLVLKDSFANSFVPYIVSDYEKIVMLDERYTFVSPLEIINSYGVNELAVIKEIVS